MGLKNTVFTFSFLLSTSIIGQAAVPALTKNEGIRILDYHLSLKEVFPAAERFREEGVLPENSGGHTFMGLVNRLLGAGVNEKYEGRLVKRFLYKAIRNKEVIGIAHGSSYEYRGDAFDVMVYYDKHGKILDVKATGLPHSVHRELKAANYFQQFRGYIPQDFHYTYYRRRRKLRKRAGKFLTSVKKPSGKLSRKYSDSILRAVRFNTAFMDVAYFITKHPDLDSKSTKIKVSRAQSGPEIHVQDTQVATPLERDSQSVRIEKVPSSTP